jgi:hypothetical protein
MCAQWIRRNTGNPSGDCRATKPEARMEAITSHALLLAGVGRTALHAGQTMLQRTPMHAAKSALMLLIANICAALS